MMTDRQMLIEILAMAAYLETGRGANWSVEKPEVRAIFRSLVDTCPAPDDLWSVIAEEERSMKAPWTRHQVEALNAYQRAGEFHPYTCGNRGDGNHPFEDEYGDHGVLRATPEGWTCPYCDYRQTWAHGFSAGIKDL